MEPFTSKILIKTNPVVAVDNIPPTINSFSIPATSASCTVPVSSFTASDKISVTGFKLTESATAPQAGDAGWSATAPNSYCFASEGTKTLCAWAKDAAGNVSAGVSQQVIITLNTDTDTNNLGNTAVYSSTSTAPNRRAIPVTFSEAGSINSISIYQNGGNGSVILGVYADQSGLPSSLLGLTTSTVINATEGWQTEALINPVTVTTGQTVWLSWVFENNPGIRYKIGTPARAESKEIWSSAMPTTFGVSYFSDYNYSIFCSYKPIEEIILPDVTKPSITAFSIPSTSTSLVVSISSFTATDNKAVTGFKLTESATAPLAGDADWTAVAPTSYSFNTEGSKTLYAWAKDAAGNVSVSMSDHVVITLPDVTKPSITAFSIPLTSTSLVISISSFTATDNKAVTGFKLTESATAPPAGDAGWTAVVPTSYSFTTEGSKTLYAWAKDAAGNVSVSMSDKVVITLPDVTKPSVTAFSIPSTSTSLVVSISSFTAIDNKAVTGFKLTESATTPLAGDAGWSVTSPVSYSFASEGTKTLYAWAMDEAGNVSAHMSGQVVITLPDFNQPVITSFIIPDTAESLTIPIIAFEASDDKFIAGYILTETQNSPLAGDIGWSTSVPATYTFSGDVFAPSIHSSALKSGSSTSVAFLEEGTKTLYAWTKDEAGNVSSSVSDQVMITLPDTIKPLLTAFSIPATSASLIVDVNIFTASDNKAVTGFKITESASTPRAGDAGWFAEAPVSFTFSSEGTKTLFAWVKDAAGNVSTSMSEQVVITLPDVTKPLITAFSIPSTSTTLVVPVTSFSATDNKSVTGFKITESAVAPNAGDAGWFAEAPVSFTFSDEGTKTLYAWVKDAAGNVSTSVSAPLVVSLPDVDVIQNDSIKGEQIITQTIELRKGWNIFSSWLIPENKNMDVVVEVIQNEGKLIRVEDENSNTYSKLNTATGWVNNIGTTDETEGYKIRVSSDCALEITGKQISLPMNINIKKGWNIISFPMNGSVDAMQLIQPLIDAGILDKVQDEKGNSIERWRNNGWVNGIGNFTGGEGYILIALGDGVLTVGDVSSKSGNFYSERFETSYFKTSYEGNGLDHMNINITDLNKTGFQIGDEIAAFDGTTCTGAIKLSEKDFISNAVSIPASAAEISGLNGFIDGNSIVLKVWKYETNEEILLIPEVTGGEMVYSRYSSVFAIVNDNQIVNRISDFDLLQVNVYPNPASSVVNVSFSNLPATGTEIRLMDMNGKEIINQKVENTNESMNINDLPAGFYLVKIQASDHLKIHKLIKN